MKILYLATRITGSGGVAKITAQKVNFWIQEWGFNIAICSSNDNNEKPFYRFDDKTQFFLHNKKTNTIPGVLRYYKRIKGIIKDFQPDVILISDNGLKAYLAPFLLSNKIPLVLEVHGSRNLLFDKNDSKIKRKIFEMVIQKAICKFNKILILNEVEADGWLRKTEVIPNFITLNSTTELIRDKQLVVAVGRISREKRYELAFEIWRLILETIPNAVFEIYGEIEDEIYYRELMEKCPPQVFFKEPTSQIENVLKSASVLIHTSVSEGFGLIIYEAIALNTPVVAFDNLILDSLVKKHIHLIPESDLSFFAETLKGYLSNNLLNKNNNIKVELPSELLQESVMKKWKLFFNSFQ